MTSRKISEFNSQTTISDPSLITFVVNGTNLNIPFSDFKNVLGVTGTLNQVGNPLGTPVLETVGTTNNIRNLESSKGVIASVSSQNGINLAANFTQGATGATIIKDLNEDIYTFKTIVAGTDINITDLDDRLVINFNPSASSTKTIVVTEEGDFPDPIAGVITLADNTDYFLGNDVSTANRFVVGSSTTIRGPASQIVKLTYTGSGSMFTGVTPNFRIDRVTVACPNGALLDMTSGIQAGIIQVIESNVESCNTIGTVSGAFICRFKGVAWEDIKTNGLVLDGANQNLVMDTGLIFLNGGDFVDFGTSTFNTVTITNQVVQTSAGGTTFIKGAASSANINTGGLGVVSNNRIFGSAAPLSGISPDDSRWNFTTNDEIQDTRPDGLLSFQTPTPTPLVAATPTLIAGPWVVERTSQFTGTVAGRLTYNGEKNSILPISCALSLEPVSGTNKTVNIYLAKNGSVITNSKVSTVVSSGSPKNQIVTWQDDFSENDYYECFIESVDGTDLQVNTATLRIN